MGSSSTSIIPVVNGKIAVNPTEIRSCTGKLLFIGEKYTPVFYLMDEVKN